MTRLAQTERTSLCDTALQVGEGRPTLCGDWTVKDLVVHLALRERSAAAVGIVVAPLSGLTDLASRRLGRTGFAELVERVRTGPPAWSPFALPPVDAAVNTMEFFVHHEDVRRAQPSWSPRTLGPEVEGVLWSSLGAPAKLLTRKVPVGVDLEDAATGRRLTAHRGPSPVTVRGPVAEVVLYVFGRREHAAVELLGDPASVSQLAGTTLGM